MSADTSSSAGNAALVVSGTGGIVAAVNEYAVVIGLALSAVSVLIGLIFHIRADRWRKSESLAKKEALRQQLIDEIRASDKSGDTSRNI